MAHPSVETPKTLTQRFLSTSFWSAGHILAEMVLRLGGNLILTRILMPEVFGLMAFAMTIQVGIVMLTDIGVERSVVRDKDGDTERYLQTAWTVRVIRSALVTIVMLLVAVVALPIVRLYVPETSVIAAPETIGVVAIISLTPLFKSLGSINEALAQRRLAIERLVLLGLGIQASNLVVMVAALLIWPTIWTMAVVLVAGVILRSILTHFVLPGPRMALVWDKDIAQRLWDYGKWIIGSSFFGFLGRYSERLIFSALLDFRLFALYSIARLWAEASQKVLQFVLGQAGMSALSEIMRTPGRDLTRPFAKIQTIVDLLCILGFLGFYFLIEAFIQAIYNDEFDPAGQIAPLLALLVLRIRFNTFDSMLLSTGKTRNLMFCTMQEAAAAWLLIWIAYQAYGFDVAVVAYSISGLFNVPYLLLSVKPFLPGRNFAIDWAWLGLSVLLSLLVIWPHL